MSVIVRKATTHDLQHVSNLTQLWASENITYGLAATSEELLRNYLGDYFWIAEVDSLIVGYVFGTVHESNGLAVIEKGELYLEIDEVYVHPDYRNDNAGHALVDKIIETSKLNGISRCVVYSATKQWQKIVGFYEEHGFQMWFVQMYR